MRARILVADDDADNRALMRLALEAAGYDVVEAVDGARALEAAADAAPALILMDLTMPRLDGLEATRRLRREPATARVPILAFTARVSEEDAARARGAGCDGFIAKPCAPREVLRAVRRWLEARP